MTLPWSFSVKRIGMNCVVPFEAGYSVAFAFAVREWTNGREEEQTQSVDEIRLSIIGTGPLRVRSAFLNSLVKPASPLLPTKLSVHAYPI